MGQATNQLGKRNQQDSKLGMGQATTPCALLCGWLLPFCSWREAKRAPQSWPPLGHLFCVTFPPIPIFFWKTAAPSSAPDLVSRVSHNVGAVIPNMITQSIPCHPQAVRWELVLLNWILRQHPRETGQTSPHVQLRGQATTCWGLGQATQPQLTVLRLPAADAQERGDSWIPSLANSATLFQMLFQTVWVHVQLKFKRFGLMGTSMGIFMFLHLTTWWPRWCIQFVIVEIKHFLQ